MSYIITTRDLVPAVKRRPRRMGALDPNLDVPGTGHTVDELRKIGWKDAELNQLLQDYLSASGVQPSPAGQQPPSAGDWLNKESLGKGIKNGYLILAGGLLLSLAAAGGRRR